jgi:pimeloyl-ACP methyl ester carboxylesterase
MNRLHRRGRPGFLTLASVLFALVFSCAGGPQTGPAANPDRSLDAFVSAPSSERGALIDAIPLARENVAAVLTVVRPEILSFQANVKPIIEAGFFRKLDELKPSLYGVRSLRIRYWSSDARGRPIQLSGALYLPIAKDPVSVPLLLLCHGTQVLRDRVPSRLQGGERPVAIILAASGVAVVMPDYPGLGDGDGFHPYCHARSLAFAGVDMLRAARAALRLPGEAALYREAPAVFVAGYSEGGYAAMAAARELELNHKNEFPLKAVFPMAGPFDMSGVMRALMLSDDPIPAPYYLPYTILGWAGSHSAIDPLRIIKREYLNEMLPVFDGRSHARLINAAIEKVQGAKPGQAVAKKMLTSEALQALTAPASSPFAEAIAGVLKENDLHDWPADPAIPLYFMAGRPDELVPYQNSVIAYEAMKARGVRTEMRFLGQESHEAGAIEGFAVMSLKIWEMLGK